MDCSSAQGIGAGRDVIAGGSINVNLTQVHPPSREPVRHLRIVESPINTFEGRAHLLDLIHSKLQGSSKDHYMKRMVVLSGLGGMGKSEIARKLVQKYREDYQNVG